MFSGMEESASARLHGGWMEHKSSEKNKWNQVWCVLKRDGTLFFFSSQNTSLETHIGTLHLTKESSFHYGPGVPREGYRFDLYISKKKKKFKVKNQYDREMWRAYIVGVITGNVPQDVTLSPQDLQMITSQFQMGPRSPSSSSLPSSPSNSSGQTPPSAASYAPGQPTSDLEESASSSSLQLLGRPRRTSLPSLASTGTGSSGEGGFDPPGTRSLIGISVGGSSHNSSDSGVSDNTGGPFMHHKFDKAGNTSTPSWFFEDCNRELAEKIVRECRHMGNTLMRVSSSARPTGSYVITKRLESSEQIVHYEVIRVSEGYTINAENINKDNGSKNTMKTLSEVMDFFIQLSGPTTTRPMKSNDLKQLGVEYDAYHRGPILPPQVTPSASSARIEPEEPDNYEVPGSPPIVPPMPAPPPPPCNVLAPPPLPSSPQKVPFNTWGKDKTGDVRRQGQQAGGSAAKTVGPADRRQIKPDSVKPSVMQVDQHLQEQHAVANLDAVLSGEERRLVDHRGGIQDKRPPLPAVPANRPKLCSPASSGYINDGSSWSDAAEGEMHQRWNKRSQSVPTLPKNVLGVHVPSTVVPPPLMKPGEGQGSAGAGGKIPPSTAPKTVRFPPRTPSLDQLDSKERDKAVPNIVSELRQKFQEKALQQAQQPQPQASSPEKTPSPPPAPQEDGELYEDIGQYYQNVSPN